MTTDYFAEPFIDMSHLPTTGLVRRAKLLNTWGCARYTGRFAAHRFEERRERCKRDSIGSGRGFRSDLSSEEDDQVPSINSRPLRKPMSSAMACVE